MNWFDILKNEMRTVNLPKFKVKPFDVNKPDEDKDDCKDHPCKCGSKNCIGFIISSDDRQKFKRFRKKN